MKKTYQVVFNFGSVVTVSVKIHEGMPTNECIKLYSKDIVGYIENGKYIEIQ